MGRGPLAGPVTAAVCAIPHGISVQGVGDSKQLTDLQRRNTAKIIRSDPRITFALGWVSAQEIDEHNIHQASLMAMARAIEALQPPPDILLIDGRFTPHHCHSFSFAFPHKCCYALVQGDRRSQAIAAASILAKVARDDYMLRLHESWPEYGFAAHKGYPTKHHLAVLTRCGPCPEHRRTFQPLRAWVAGDSGPREGVAVESPGRLAR